MRKYYYALKYNFGDRDLYHNKGAGPNLYETYDKAEAVKEGVYGYRVPDVTVVKIRIEEVED